MTQAAAILSENLAAAQKCEIAAIREADAGIAGLTSRMRAGDEAAWTEFYARYGPRLLRYLLVVANGREEVAREALQQTFLRAVRNMRTFSTEATLWSWLTVLARSAVTDERRKEGRFLGFLARWFAHKAVEGDADSGGNEQLALMNCLELELEALPEEERELVEQKYAKRAPTRVLAESAGATEKAIESRLARIRQKLKTGILNRIKHERTH